MKAAIVQGPGRTPEYADFPAPAPAEGERLVRVTAAALTQLARGRASGAHYSASGAYPFVAGVDGVGRLEDGARVYFLLPRAPYGAFADEAVVSALQCLPVPDDLDDVTAAAIANPGMSSWAALTDRAKLAPGETVLVNGATGTSGRLAVQIARHLGAKRVIATGRNREALASLGADATIALGADDAALEASFRDAFAGTVDVVLDYLWGRSAELCSPPPRRPRRNRARSTSFRSARRRAGRSRSAPTCCARRRSRSWAAASAACRDPASWLRSAPCSRRRSRPGLRSPPGRFRSPTSEPYGRRLATPAVSVFVP